MENSLSFDDRNKADIVIIDAMMNLMTTSQNDDEDLTKYTKHFKVMRDLCKEKYRGIFKIPTFTQKESTWGSDEEGSYKTAYASFLSILYLKNTDQMKYGSFIKKVAENFATGWENVDLTHIEDAQHILSIDKYDQAYHDKQKKQQDDHDKGCMSSKNDDCSTSGNVPNILEMSFTQMEGQCYKCGAKGHLSHKCTKDVPRGQWYVDKIKVQDAQLMQANGATR